MAQCALHAEALDSVPNAIQDGLFTWLFIMPSVFLQCLVLAALTSSFCVEGLYLFPLPFFFILGGLVGQVPYPDTFFCPLFLDSVLSCPLALGLW